MTECQLRKYLYDLRRPETRPALVEEKGNWGVHEVENDLCEVGVFQKCENLEEGTCSWSSIDCFVPEVPKLDPRTGLSTLTPFTGRMKHQAGT